MLNLKVRIKNPAFWLAFIPAAILLIGKVAELFGLQLDLSGAEQTLLDIARVVFTLLALLGVVNDPTTQGLSDSTRAMTYEVPYGAEEDEEQDI